MTDITVTEVTVRDREAPRMIYGSGRPYRSTTWREYNSKPRIYFSAKGETLFENLCFRQDRPYQVYRRFLGEALEALGLPPTTKCNWSQYAGCSMCPCSPGFIVQAPGIRKDCWVTLEGVEQPITDLALSRADQVLADPTLAPFMPGPVLS